MSDQTRSKLIIGNPIGNGLSGFRATFVLNCEGADLWSADEAVDRLKQEGESPESSITFLFTYLRMQIFKISLSAF
jgi:hypothetical protein